jgi:hypothetical protein
LSESAARRNEKANYTLSIDIANSELGAAPASDAKVPGTPYHATSSVPCSIGPDPKGSAQCELGVIRGKPGNAEIHVTPPGGGTRVLNFRGEQVDRRRSQSTSESDEVGRQLVYLLFGFQVETPACGIWPITAPPFSKNLFCTIITIEVAVIDKSPYPNFLALDCAHLVSVYGESVLAD